jgi:hypothetical protein
MARVTLPLWVVGGLNAWSPVWSNVGRPIAPPACPEVQISLMGAPMPVSVEWSWRIGQQGFRAD